MKLLVLSLFAFLCVSAIKPAEKARFDNYRLYQVSIENEEQFRLMKEIENHPDGYQFWDFPGEIGKHADLVVPPHKFGEFSELVETFELKSRMVNENLQELFDNEQPKKRSKAVGDWTSYWTYDEINEWLDSLVETYPGIVSHVNVGKSYQSRDIRGVKVNIGGGQKNSVVLEATIHAREWISTATTTWMLNELLTSTDPEVQDIAKSFEWYVFPVTNPDGYVYTWTTNRSWRKTRKPSNAICFGADPNRNWDNHFAEGGASTNPCSDLYAGSAPFSEPETKALSEYLRTIPNLVGYFAFHAYGQMMMTPFGWTKELLGNYHELYEIGQKGVEALTAKFGTRYSLGSIANVIYIASGSSVDWVKDTLKANITYAYEFRDEGRDKFILPADQIIDNSIEVFASLVTIMKEAKSRGSA
ncbi:CLUMA_CG015125, isoform A [Clunio marinus]|uniref:Zinc carboxypeptidase A 1 n=1 Tax=Clunio marinus TaxID=568069 RepID=A0A1J1IRB0_9DIPT|nr:CLUMA_CG015125, isoform A [Clunio marinus]